MADGNGNGNKEAVQLKALQAFPDSYLECRDGNHSWGKTNYSFENRDKVVHRMKTCSRCTARQESVVVRHTGEYLVRPRIWYPQGYTVKGTGRIYKQSVRKESVRRVYSVYAKARREGGGENVQAGSEVG